METELEATQQLVIKMASQQSTKMAEKHSEKLKEIKAKNKKVAKKRAKAQSTKDKEQAMRMCAREVFRQMQAVSRRVFGAMRRSFQAHMESKATQRLQEARDSIIEAKARGDLLVLEREAQKAQLRELTLQNATLKQEHSNWVFEREVLRQQMLQAQFEAQATFALGRLRVIFRQFASDTMLKKDGICTWRGSYQRAMCLRAEQLAAQVSILKEQLQARTHGSVVKHTSETVASCESRGLILSELASQHNQKDISFALLSRAEQQSRLQGQLRGLMGEVPDKVSLEEKWRMREQLRDGSHKSALAMGLKVGFTRPSGEHSTTNPRESAAPFKLQDKEAEKLRLLAQVDSIVLHHPALPHNL